MEADPRARLEVCLAAALAAVDGGRAVGRAVTRRGSEVLIAGQPLRPGAGIHVLAIGKAAAPMARAAVASLGDRLEGGLVVTRDGHAAEAPSELPVLYAGHPVPDARSAEAGIAVLEAAARVEAGDVLLVLLSGGASALTSCPAEGLAIEDLVSTTEVLLACAADIEEINCLRKHLSAIAGGRLARASTAGRIVMLAVSDVPGDRLDVIGSGPCTADATRFADAQAIVARLGIAGRLPERVLRHLDKGARGDVPESVKPGDAALLHVTAHIVARNRDARQAALEAAHSWSDAALDLGEILRGEARIVGRRLVGLASATRGGGPRLLIAGGETVVRLEGTGRGGRNQELALAAAIEIDARRSGPAIHLLAAGTDGTDGPTDAAGGFVDGRSAGTARAAGLDPQALLDVNDSHRFLATTGGLLVTGPTGTNVMDLAMILSEPDRRGALR